MSDDPSASPVEDIVVTRTPPASSGLTVEVGGAVLSDFVSGEVSRHMKDVAGAFRVTYVDQVRAAQSGYFASPGTAPFVKEGGAVRVKIDGELVLDGWIDEIELSQTYDELGASVTGRDKTGDLVDCAAAPNGPAEFNGVDLLAVATTICKPFGISVRSDTDVGDPFVHLALGPHEKAMHFLEKAARQRSILLVSDGVGGLLLTTGGATDAAAPITVGENVVSARGRASWRERYSDVYVKGQTDSRARRAGRAPALTHDSEAEDAPAPAAAPDEAATALMTGHASDPEITRWRPDVRLTRTQSGMSTTQAQAEWAVRTARGLSRALSYTVLGWRGGPNLQLWRPNTLAAVYDPYAGIDATMMIAGVTYRWGPEGATTELEVVGPTAYDRINEADRRRQRHRKGPGKPLDGAAVSIAPETDEAE